MPRFEPEEARDRSGFERTCCHATMAGLVGTGSSLGGAPALADRAMELLRDAYELGYRDVVAYRNDPGLDAVRQRDDFQLLMLDLDFPARPFAR